MQNFNYQYEESSLKFMNSKLKFENTTRPRGLYIYKEGSS